MNVESEDVEEDAKSCGGFSTRLCQKPNIIEVKVSVLATEMSVILSGCHQICGLLLVF